MQKTYSRLAWALLCAFIIYGSMGTWAFYQPGIWAPTLVSGPDVALNVLVYVVFGALGVLSRLRAGGAPARQAPAPWWRVAVKVSVIALLFSAANEALQLYTIDRVASVTDILSAAVGALAGGISASSPRQTR